MTRARRQPDSLQLRLALWSAAGRCETCGEHPDDHRYHTYADLGDNLSCVRVECAYCERRWTVTPGQLEEAQKKEATVAEPAVKTRR